jgi:Leucine-rich repeat (LRR) protein
VEDNFVTIWNGDVFSKNYSSNKIRRLSIQKDISAQVKEIAKTIKNAAHIRSISIFGSNSVLVDKHASEFLNSQVLRVLNIEGVLGECNLGHVNSFGQLKYLRAADKLPEDIGKLQHLETLDVRETWLQNLPTCIIHLQKLVRLSVPGSVHLPDEIGNLQALEELSRINFGIQSVEFIQGLGDLTNLRVLEIDWNYSTKVRDMKGHNKACISTLSRLFRHMQELCVWESDPDATCSFMASCVPTPPLQ